MYLEEGAVDRLDCAPFQHRLPEVGQFPKSLSPFLRVVEIWSIIITVLLLFFVPLFLVSSTEYDVLYIYSSA
jgi:hypothetical protein